MPSTSPIMAPPRVPVTPTNQTGDTPMLNQHAHTPAGTYYCVTALTLQPAAPLRISVPTYMDALREVRTLIREALPAGGVVEVYPPDDPEPEGCKNIGRPDGRDYTT